MTSSEKGPIVFYILSIYIAYNMSYKEKVVLNVRLLLGTVLGLFLIYYIIVSEDFGEIKQLILERVLFAQMAVVYYSYDYYNYSNFIGFDSLGGFFNKVFDLMVLPPSSEVLMKVYFNEMIVGGGWNINGVYIYEAWSNFGLIGVIFAPIYVGSILAFFYLILSSLKGTFGKAILIFYSASCFSFITSFNAYIYSTTTVLVVLIFFVRFIFIKLLK